MKNFIFATIVAAAALSACSEKISLDVDRQGTEKETELSHDMIVLGEQLSDPYSVDNMTKALNSLYPSTKATGHLEPTDFYVRFLPKDQADMQLLAEKGVVMLDHPLDYRIVREGDWYHDPEIPENNITWQYAVVPVDFEFPKNIRYERLEDCYLSEHDPVTKADGIDWLEVEREAFRLSGNASMLAPRTKAGDEVCFPEGYIKISDPDFSNEPVGVKGIRVCCNSFVKVAMAYTDEDGHYKMSRTYSTELRYRLMFKNIKGFCQGLNFVLVPASVSTLGSQPAEGCSVTIDNYSNYYLFTRCVVNNAGYDYYQACEQSSGDIPLPPTDLRIWDVPILGSSFNIMMHHGVLLETFNPLHEVLGLYTIIAKIVQPDIYYGIDGCSSYNEAYQRALKAFAQAGHFAQVGMYWWQEYVISEVGETAMMTFAELLGSIGSSNGNGGVGSYADIVHTYSNYCTTVLYQRHYTSSRDVMGERLYSPQMLMYLDERGLGLEKLAPMFTSDVISYDVLKQKMLSYYPQFKNTILEAFARYEK